MVVWLWVGFIALIVGLLALDLGVLNRKAHVIGVREAIGWTVFWVVLALLFNGAIYFMYEQHWLGIGLHAGSEENGRQAALQFFTGYLIEKSLSLDNIFVIALIFTYFKVPAIHQHRVLFWGILGALVMRGAMILAGVALIRMFDWIIYVFGVLLILTAIKMLLSKEDEIEPERNPLVRLARRAYPVSGTYLEHHFFTTIDGKRAITPLFLVLLLVESTDVLFAVDSIPAIFGITTDPFIVFTSNVFAILGLRSLYFALAAVLDKFRYLKVSLVFVLAFIGVKMLLSHHVEIPTPLSLGVIAAALTAGVAWSIAAARRQQLRENPGAPDVWGSVAYQAWRHTRRVIISVVGVTVLLIGLALLVLPGPGWLVIAASIAILATEFVWARRLLRRMQLTAKDLIRRGTGRGAAPAPPRQPGREPVSSQREI